MTTFQAIAYGVLHGFTEFLPVGSAAHRILLAFFTGWNEPSGALLGVMSLGSALALIVYFIHDWLSMLSSFLQILIYRKKPMTLDERMPLFLFITSIPLAGVWYYFHEDINARLDSSPLVVAMTLAGFGVLLWLAESMSRRNKNTYDWNVLDSIIVGVTQLAALVPGCGRTTGALTGAFFRNYSRAAAAKFTFYAAAPALVGSAFVHLRDVSFGAAAPMMDVSWLTFYVTLIVAFFSSLLGVGAFMKHIQRGGMAQYAVWRIVLAAAVIGTHFMRLRSG